MAAVAADNAVGNFQMAGSLAKHLIEADEKITVEVSRLVGKVSYTIRTAFTGPLAGKEFRVEDIYLTNVSGENDLVLSRCAPALLPLWTPRKSSSRSAATTRLARWHMS